MVVTVRRIGLLQEISAAGSLPTGMLSLSRMHFEAVSFQRCVCLQKFRGSVVPTVRCGLGLSPSSVVLTVPAGTKHSEPCSVVSTAFVSEESGNTQYRSSGACFAKIPRQCPFQWCLLGEISPESERQELGCDPGEVVRKTAPIVPALTVSPSQVLSYPWSG